MTGSLAAHQIARAHQLVRDAKTTDEQQMALAQLRRIVEQIKKEPR